MSRYSAFLVLSQTLLLVYLLLSNSFTFHWLYLGIQGLGLFIAIWGVVTLRLGNFNIQPEVRSTALITKGPYRWIRNPMYLGILLFFLPTLFIAFSLPRSIAFCALLVVFILKMYREEQLLEVHFGEDYKQYKDKTFRLIPFLL